MNEYLTALEAHDLVRQGHAAAGDLRGVALATMEMAQCHLNYAEHDKAIVLFRSAEGILARDLPARGQLPDIVNAAQALVGVSYALTGLGRFEEALTCALEAGVRLDPYRSARVSAAEAAAAACLGAGDIDGAHRHYRDALSLLPAQDLTGRERVCAKLDGEPSPNT